MVGIKKLTPLVVVASISLMANSQLPSINKDIVGTKEVKAEVIENREAIWDIDLTRRISMTARKFEEEQLIAEVKQTLEEVLAENLKKSNEEVMEINNKSITGSLEQLREEQNRLIEQEYSLPSRSGMGRERSLKERLDRARAETVQNVVDDIRTNIQEYDKAKTKIADNVKDTAVDIGYSAANKMVDASVSIGDTIYNAEYYIGKSIDNGLSTVEEWAQPDYYGPVLKDVPQNVRNEFKSFMDYRTITSRGSNQYKLQHMNGTYTNEEGFRVHNGEYLVAVGSYYTNVIGTRLKVNLANGNSFYAVVGDQKSDAHTDAKHQHRNGNVVEFIVDQKNIPTMCKKMGDMSYAEGAGLKGKIASIEVLDRIEIA